MAFVRFPVLGETMVETVLWTNPNPTTATGSMTVALSESIINFDYIGLYIRKANTTAGAVYGWVYAKSSDLYDQFNTTNTWGMALHNGNYARVVRYVVSSNSMVIGATFRAGDSGTSAGSVIPQKISGFKLGIPKIPVIISSLGAFYRDKVLNGTFDVTLPLTINTSRATINEGGNICVDTTNRKGYFYLDMTMVADYSTSDWRNMGTFDSTISSYLPKGTSNNRNTYVSLICDDTSDHNISTYIGYISSSYTRNFCIGYAEPFTIGDRIILYNSWSY